MADLIFRSTLEVRSVYIDPDCLEGDDNDVMDEIGDEIRDALDSLARLLKNKYPDHDLDISYEV